MNNHVTKNDNFKGKKMIKRFDIIVIQPQKCEEFTVTV